MFGGFQQPSNYPPNHGGYGGPQYPSNSGPPPPPMGGYGHGGYGGYQQQQYSAYNNFGGMMGGMMAGMMGGMCNAVQSMHNSYPMGNQPPPQQPQIPQSYTYSPYDQQRRELDMQRMMYQQMGFKAPSKRELYDDQTYFSNPSAPANDDGCQQQQREEEPEQTQDDSNSKEIDNDIKEKMKSIFVEELMRRYAVSATYEMASGTICPMMKYHADDPVVAWYNKERSHDIAGEAWDAEYDCEFLRHAMRGFGTTESMITHIVSTRCNAQRQKLKQQFKTQYGRDLIEDIVSELSGDYRDAIVACFVSPAYFDAKCIKKAIYGAGTDEQALIEILMTRTNLQIKETRAVYGEVARPNKKTKDTLLDDDIKGDTSGDFKRLLTSASQGNRYEISREKLEQAVVEILNANGDGTGMFEVDYSKLCDVNKAKRDAERLFKAGEDRWGTDEETFNLIFATRNFYQLRETYRQYVKITQADIRNAVDGETSGNFRKGLQAVAECVMNRPRYLAKRLMKSMKGLGTDEDTLTRIIASRSEIDMMQIKAEFLEMTKKTVYRYIEEDCSFNYRKILQALVGKD